MKKNLILFLLISLTFGSMQAFSQILKLNLSASPEGICEGDSVTLRVTYIPGTNQPRLVNYKWTASTSTTFSPDASYPTVKAKPLSKTTFSIKLTNADNPSDTLSGSITVGVTPRPIAFAGKDTIRCVGEYYDMNPEVEKGSIYRWKHNGKGTYNDSTKLRPRYTPAPGETGWIKHVLTVMDYEFCNVVKDSMMLGYIEPPFVQIQPPVKQNICLDTKYLLTVDTKSNPAVKIRWRKTSGYGTIQDPESTTMTYVPDQYDRGNVQFIVDAWWGGCHNADTILVPVAPIIFEYVPPTLEFCEGKPEFLCVTPCNGCTYKWSTGATSNCITITPTKNTTLTIEVTNKEGCYRKDTIDIKVLPSPPLPEIDDDETNKIITVTPENMEEYIFMIKGDTVPGELNKFNYRKYMSVADSIHVIITNDVGCSSEKDHKIRKLICVDAFSPNGDGINDLLLPGRKITVFDRTQKILYQGWDGWDGRLSGREMPEGTYFYVLFDESNNVFCKTPVTLLRSMLAK